MIEKSLRKIAVFRALQLGDLMCTVPAFRALRQSFPKSAITLIGLPWAQQFAGRFSHLINDFIAFPGFTPLPEHHADIRRFPEFLQKVQERRFDLLVQMHGNGKYVNPLISLFGARRTAGYTNTGHFTPDNGIFFPWTHQQNEIMIYVQLMERLGIPSTGIELEFPLFANDIEDLNQVFPEEHIPPEGYICIHPGARRQTRRWPPERFARIADHCLRLGYQVVLSGTTAERDIGRRIEASMDGESVNLIGQTSLGALGALIQGTRLLLANDTGVSHIAAALRTPSIIIVTGSDPGRWAPLDANLHRTVSATAACRPCNFDVCPFGLFCAENISDDTIKEAIFRQLYLPKTSHPLEKEML